MCRCTTLWNISVQNSHLLQSRQQQNKRTHTEENVTAISKSADTKPKQESLADAKESARRQCVYEDP